MTTKTDGNTEHNTSATTKIVLSQHVRLSSSGHTVSVVSLVVVFFRVVRVGDGVATLSLRFGAGDFLLERPFLDPMDEDEDAIAS